MNFYTSNDISQVLCCRSLNVYYSSDWIFWSSWILWNARNDQTFWFYLSICHLLWSARLLINVRITLLARYQSPPDWGPASLNKLGMSNSANLECQLTSIEPFDDHSDWRKQKLNQSRGGDGQAFNVRQRVCTALFTYNLWLGDYSFEINNLIRLGSSATSNWVLLWQKGVWLS